jgi:hypothetical protein
MDPRPYIDLLEDTDLRRGHGYEAVHRFVRRHRFEERTRILRPYIDLLEDLDLRRGHRSEAVHRFVWKTQI